MSVAIRPSAATRHRCAGFGPTHVCNITRGAAGNRATYNPPAQPAQRENGTVSVRLLGTQKRFLRKKMIALLALLFSCDLFHKSRKNSILISHRYFSRGISQNIFGIVYRQFLHEYCTLPFLPILKKSWIVAVVARTEWRSIPSWFEPGQHRHHRQRHSHSETVYDDLPSLPFFSAA